jgi:hypothetical protein
MVSIVCESGYLQDAHKGIDPDLVRMRKYLDLAGKADEKLSREVILSWCIGGGQSPDGRGPRHQKKNQIARIISHQGISSGESRLKMMLKTVRRCQRVDHESESGAGRILMGAELV